MSFDTLMTADHVTMGTPAYMAPEIILGDPDVDRRADVYAVGCVAYFLLTGQRVFDNENPMKLLMQHVQEEPIPPSHRSEQRLPREIDDLVLACLQKDPNQRPRDAGQLLQMIGDLETDGWGQKAARKWWEMHLPQFAGPLTAGIPGWDVGGRALAGAMAIH